MHIGIAGPIDISSINLKYSGDRSSWPVGMGGVPVNHLINALLELGFKISVFSSTPEIEVGNSFEWHEDNISIYMGPFRKRARSYCKDFFEIESNYIKNVIIKANPDIVHAHWQYEWALGALKSGFKTLITCHDSPVDVLKNNFNLYRIYRLFMAIIIMKKGTHFTTVSDSCAKSLKFITSKKITVIPNFEPDFVFRHYTIRKISSDKFSIAMINNGFSRLNRFAYEAA